VISTITMLIVLGAIAGGILVGLIWMWVIRGGRSWFGNAVFTFIIVGCLAFAAWRVVSTVVSNPNLYFTR